MWFYGGIREKSFWILMVTSDWIQKKIINDSDNDHDKKRLLYILPHFLFYSYKTFTYIYTKYHKEKKREKLKLFSSKIIVYLEKKVVKMTNQSPGKNISRNDSCKELDFYL